MTGWQTIVAIWLLALASSGPAEAQTGKRVPVVGVLWHAANVEEEEPFRRPLLEGFARLGYEPGKNIVFEERFANETPDLFRKFAAELAGLKLDVLLAVSNPSALAAQRATSTMPIVFCPTSDPVGLKLVASLAHPGGNITGQSAMMTADISAKRMQLLKHALPAASRVALLVNPAAPPDRARAIDDAQSAGSRLGMTVEIVDAATAAEIDQAMAAVGRNRPDALVVSQTALFFAEKDRIGRLIVAHRMPSMAPTGLFAESGALMSYGAHWPTLFRNCATYVDRILKGAKPGEIPVQQPTHFELVINVKTAAALGIALSSQVLSMADRLIEE